MTLPSMFGLDLESPIQFNGKTPHTELETELDYAPMLEEEE